MTAPVFDIKGMADVDWIKLPPGITATMSEIGVLTVTGRPLVEITYKAETAQEIGGRIGTLVYELRAKLDWKDVLAFKIVEKTLNSSPYNGRPVYYAGRRPLDELSVLMIAQEIADSAGAKSWNSVMIQKQQVDPLPDPAELTNVDSPFNPDSIYYDPKKPVFSYDPDKGYIIYRSGEIIWTKTGGVYYDQANGQAVSYDGKTVRFFTGNVLNLETLELTKADGGKSTVSNKLSGIQKFFRKLLTDTNTQLIVLGSLIALMVLKKRRNEK